MRGGPIGGGTPLMTPSRVARILAVLLAAMPATLICAEQTNLVRGVHVGETHVRTNRSLSYRATGPHQAYQFTFDPPITHPADTGVPMPGPLAVPGGTDPARSAGTVGWMAVPTATTLTLPPLEDLQVPDW